MLVKFNGYTESVTYDKGTIEANRIIKDTLEERLGDKVKDAKAFLLGCEEIFDEIVDIEGDYPLISRADCE